MGKRNRKCVVKMKEANKCKQDKNAHLQHYMHIKRVRATHRSILADGNIFVFNANVFQKKKNKEKKLKRKKPIQS